MIGIGRPERDLAGQFVGATDRRRRGTPRTRNRRPRAPVAGRDTPQFDCRNTVTRGPNEARSSSVSSVEPSSMTTRRRLYMTRPNADRAPRREGALCSRERLRLTRTASHGCGRSPLRATARRTSARTAGRQEARDAATQAGTGRRRTLGSPSAFAAARRDDVTTEGCGRADRWCRQAPPRRRRIARHEHVNGS